VQRPVPRAIVGRGFFVLRLLVGEVSPYVHPSPVDVATTELQVSLLANTLQAIHTQMEAEKVAKSARFGDPRGTRIRSKCRSMR
jgi:hypothetical protein